MTPGVKKILIVLAVVAAIIAAFYLGQRTRGVSLKKKPQARQGVQAKAAGRKKGIVPPVPAVAQPSRAAKVAIVIDDFGYNTNNLAAFFDIKEPLTFSILPNLPHSRDVAERARRHGCEVILHLPLESHRKDVVEEPDTIKPGESRKEVIARLAKDIGSVPGLTGVSNHMGSKATEDKALMSEIFMYLKKHDLYFFDSLTSDKSVCRETAKDAGLRFAKRDIFLDNSNDIQKIGIELADLEKLAFKRGRAIAICHDRKNTASALAKVLPQMVEDGIEFVYLSEMANPSAPLGIGPEQSRRAK